MKSKKSNASKDILYGILPQAINNIRRSIIDPLFSDNYFDKYANEKPPLRSELFTVQQMEQFAQKLATQHKLTAYQPSEQLLKRLSENEQVMLEVHSLLTESVKQNDQIVPAAEWLLDNFYLIEEQIYTGKKHLPKGYSKGLPNLASGESKGLPRVYDIATGIISHTDGRVDLQNLTSFISTYQNVTFLKIGELWAIPIMLRLALLENLRRLAVQIAIDVYSKRIAKKWANLMIEAAEKDPKNLVLIISDMVRSKPPMESSFVAELFRMLQGKGPSLALSLSWIEQNLLEKNLTSSELVHLENQKQATDQVSISNSINSLRFLNTTDWRVFVEQESIIEKIMQKDPANVYSLMDFATRDHYRHVIEKMSKYSSTSEKEIAEMVLQATLEKLNDNDKKNHVGYYLISKGVKQIEKKINLKLPIYDKAVQLLNKSPIFFYITSIVIITFLSTYKLIQKTYIPDQHEWEIILFFTLICLIAVSQLAVTLINWLTTLIVPPRLLPRMNFSKGIPEDNKTLVVIPCIINNIVSIDELIESLEVRFIANRDKNLHFALLTDFADSSSEILPEDESLLDYLRSKIFNLNKKYLSSQNEIFLLFHRPRQWNEKEGVWMGYERKRGKLVQLNELLRENNESHFSLIIGNREIFSKIKYVITLDSDTMLPKDTAWKMIGTMAHPLNHPVYSEKKQRIIDGYGILQPRVSTSLPPTDGSLYAKINSSDPGTDPYTKAISEVYQDLFCEGSFIGKGIYDIEAFEKVLKGKLPDNRILSHDLLEGCYIRSGIISDVQLYEHYPPTYNADIKRRHRWIRGDWQIALWLYPKVPDQNKSYIKNNLSILSRWKIFDNLRRSLTPICLILMLYYGWFFSNSFFWTSVTLSIIFFPLLIAFIKELWHKPSDVKVYPHLAYCINSIKNRFLQHSLNLIFLPYEAYVNTDAIIRTEWRIHFSKKRLLQWFPYRHSLNGSPQKLIDNFISMWIAPFAALATCGTLIYYSISTFLIALPVLLLWICAPAVAWFISLPEIKLKFILGEEKIRYLRKLSRKIWMFFETFIGPEDNWLPPDNYQEHPFPRIAHRTSPTNIGIALLSYLTAYDFGYISSGQLVNICGNTLKTIQAMEKYKGHLYNWYDTTSLIPLQPKYVSTVDSGNLLASLITLKQGLLTIINEKIFSIKAFNGLLDTVELLSENNKKNTDALQPLKDELISIINAPHFTLNNVKDSLKKLETIYAEIKKHFKVEGNPNNEPTKEIGLLGKQLNDIVNEFNMFTPWLLEQATPHNLTPISSIISPVPSLIELSNIETELLPLLKTISSTENSLEENQWIELFTLKVIEASKRAKERILLLERLAALCMELANVEYEFLYDSSQYLFSIGYDVEENRKDNSYYDLLASEARLSTFVAIAQGSISQESWFALGRQLTNVGTTPILLSWSGSMFEYLMPLLLMPSYENTLLDQTHKSVVEKQIEYGKKRGVPWGISESGYNAVDSNLNYQYRAFGVPGLGFKRGLSEDLVISPYSTFLALMVMPEPAYNNLQLMSKEGFEGKYGFYEAIDYTKARLPRNKKQVIVKSFMAHHQAMSFLSLSNLLLDAPIHKYFLAEVHFQSAILLLQERIPRVSTFYSSKIHASDINILPNITQPSIRVINTPHTAFPQIQLLSNGRYSVMVTNAGGSYSKWKDISVTRWREDATCDNWGIFSFIHDIDNNFIWSSTYQPSLQETETYEVVFSLDRAEFKRKAFSLDAHTEIIVSPEDDIELRRMHLTNRSRRRRRVKITSYAEVILANQNVDAAHPAFSNLFIQSEIISPLNAIVCIRRPRHVHEHSPAMFHIMKVYHAQTIETTYETDRTKFIGRGNNIHSPDAIYNQSKLSNTQGAVLDPIVAIQYYIEIEPQQTAVIDMIFGATETKEACYNLIENYQDKYIADRAIELSWTHSQVVLRQINATENDAQLYTRLASAVIFVNPPLRADPNIISRNIRGQSGLWSSSVSGDLPIVLLQIENASNIGLVKQLIQAHRYWRLKGLLSDLVIWNEDHGGYRQLLHNEILSLIEPTFNADSKEEPGGIFIRSADQISNEDRILFQTVARIVIADKLGTLEEQINKRIVRARFTIPDLTPVKFYPFHLNNVEPPKDLKFYNGIGGFTKNGKEYVIIRKPKQQTPAPWINILANEQFGSIVSENGQSYTWAENAHEFRLTPWNNDPITDLTGESFFIRDEENGKFWSPIFLHRDSKSNYITHHGFGYSIFKHNEDGIYSEVTMFVHQQKPIKFIIIKIKNISERTRKLTITGYVEWILSDVKTKSQMHITTEIDMHYNAIYARNPYNTVFQHQIAFFATNERIASFTTDRTEFIGRNGALREPTAMNKKKLSGKFGAAIDPCAAIQLAIDISANNEYEMVFQLGAASSKHDINNLIDKYRTLAEVHAALSNVKEYWNNILTTVEVKTPDESLNLLTNGWLNYQTLACRIWGRSGFYQSGGAFGFRDQLQDVLSLLHLNPDIARKQILLNASHQFKEGDVQHWWHPPSNTGVRTRCSDDYLWLPYVTARYIQHTGDTQILDEQVPYLEGRLLNTGEESYYDQPMVSLQITNLYNHCIKAIEYGLKFGNHGLPLIGSGDWNDGLDKVGIEGKGESVWLAFFLYDVLIHFSKITQIKNDDNFYQHCIEQAEQLQKNIEEYGWSGSWYYRAFFDDGSPVGGPENDECKIDSISQSWSVLSSAGNTQRAKMSLELAVEYLVDKQNEIIKLLTPPFNHSKLNPGYIKGYVPGVRENGGQYTHAAIWLAMALISVGNKKQSWNLISMINPINKNINITQVEKYKVEPYIMAADVYAEPQHMGKGGWTWYTGSAGWMYQLIIESLLGITKKGNELHFNPCVPNNWESYIIKYKYKNTKYTIIFIINVDHQKLKLILDGVEIINKYILLKDDLLEHEVKVHIGKSSELVV